MNFQDAEKTYKDLKAQHAANKLSDSAFEAEVGKLRLQDTQGRWWQIGVQTGEWYMHDGQKWSKAQPPTNDAPPVLPNLAPEAPTPAVTKPLVPTKPVAPVGVTPKPEPTPKAEKTSALPARLFSSKPANGGRAGLPMPALIAIVVVVALVGIGIIVGAYFALTGGTKPTPTPTKAVAIVPTLVLPTIAPTVAPTAVLPPTPVMTTTGVLTGTNPLTATIAAPKPTSAAPKATATKKPVATPVPAGTATPNVPPGIYVTKLQTDPAVVNIGDSIGFKMTMLNTSGQLQTYTWIVKVFSCPEQCTGDNAFRNSYGESLRTNSNVATGSVEITSPQHVNFGTGRCDYIAIPYYIDQTNQQLVQFQTIKGGALFYQFSVCH